MTKDQAQEIGPEKSYGTKKEYSSPTIQELGSIGGLVKSGSNVGVEGGLGDDYNAAFEPVS
jgi:hypothetical protein